MGFRGPLQRRALRFPETQRLGVLGLARGAERGESGAVVRRVEERAAEQSASGEGGRDEGADAGWQPQGEREDF